MKTFCRVFLLLSLPAAFLLSACGSGTPASSDATATAQAGIAVIIHSPASNSNFEQGTAIMVNSTVTAWDGVVLVELIVDGRVVQNSPTPNGQPQPQYTLSQTWNATTLGQHILTVRATDLNAKTSDANINVNVLAASPTAGQATVVPLPTLRPTPIPVTPTQTICTLNAAFLGDVTIPDNTALAPGATFVKTWQIQNTGTCDWGAGFSFVFVSGEQMNAPSPSPIPAAAAGQTINVSLNMVAPTAPGRHQSVWQLQASNGALFGTRVDALINVAGAPTAIPPTPATACSGFPQIASFIANPATIQAGQTATLSWGLVTNATNVVLQSPQGSSGVVTPGQIQVQPATTTIYTLFAYCYNSSVQAQTTVTVQNAPTPTPEPSNPNQLRSIQVDKNGDTYQVTVQYFWNGDDAPATIRAVGVNESADPVTNQAEAPIQANFLKYVILNLNGKGADKIDVCMMGRSGEELVCASQPVK